MALLQPVLLNTSTPHFTHKPRPSIHTKKPNPSVSIVQPHNTHHFKAKFLSSCAVATDFSGGVSVESEKSGDQDVVIDVNEGLGSVREVVEYDWTQEWYPLYLTKNIPDDSPLGLTVFDKQVVLYKDGSGELQCYEDRCPHRLAKLSEGQLVDGRLECLYHGWQFEGEGKCVKIPQLPTDAKIPRSACVKTYEVRDSQGVVWVWMSRTIPPNPEKIPWFENFARPGFQDFSTTHELPYDHSILLENLMDPAHVPISHDRTDWSAKREDAQALRFKVTERTDRGFAGWWGKDKEESLLNFLRFEAPCNLQNNREIVDEKTGEKNYFSGLFLCRPSGQGKSMLIVRFGTTKRSPVAKLFPEWYFHQNASKVFEQDMGFLSSQNEILMKAKVPTKELYINLKSSDTWVAEYRKWMDKVGHGMPYHFGHNTISLPKEPAVVEHAPAGLVASISNIYIHPHLYLSMAATTLLRVAALAAPHPPIKPTNRNSFACLSLTPKRQTHLKSHCSSLKFTPLQFSHRVLKRHRFGLGSVCFASSGETTGTQEVEEEVQEAQLEDNSESTDVEDGETATEDETTDAEEPASAILASLQSYKEAVANNDEPKIAEIEALLQSIEDEKVALESKVATLSAELSYEKDRVLRISADFENFRKRTERERLSLVTNAKGEVVESLLPVLDNFDRANTQIKVETEGEGKINNSYQSISKQFSEVLGSLGVVPVETTGNPFDPMLHEAIMREDSDEFEEGIILQEFRKGFLLGDRLLRPSMVKVSAGPGPAKSESVQQSEESEESEDVIEPKEEDSSEPTSTED